VKIHLPYTLSTIDLGVFVFAVTGFFTAPSAFVSAACAYFACAARTFSADRLAAATIGPISSLLYILVMASALVRNSICISHVNCPLQNENLYCNLKGNDDSRHFIDGKVNEGRKGQETWSNCDTDCYNSKSSLDPEEATGLDPQHQNVTI
jgi:hypothetical protein